MQKEQNNSFYDLICDIIETKEYGKMRKYKHHLYGSTYDHSIRVAYLCYQHHQRFKSKVNINELIRGALLHDYFLYDRHDKSGHDHINGMVHGFTHPKKALENALIAYPDLTKIEQDMIERHMFPFTPIPPKTRCGWLVCFYDKVAAVGEYCSKNKWKNKIVLSGVLHQASNHNI